MWALASMACYVLFVRLVERGQHLLATPRAWARRALASGLALISPGATAAAGI